MGLSCVMFGYFSTIKIVFKTSLFYLIRRNILTLPSDGRIYLKLTTLYENRQKLYNHHEIMIMQKCILPNGTFKSTRQSLKPCSGRYHVNVTLVKSFEHFNYSVIHLAPAKSPVRSTLYNPHVFVTSCL